MHDIVTDNYVGRYNGLYKRSMCRGSFEYASPIKLQAVEIHIPKNFNVMYEMTHRALEYLGVLGKDDTWSFEFEPEYTALVVYDKKGEKTQWVELDLKQEALLLYRDRYGSMVRTSELPSYHSYAVMFNILELIPTKEVEVKPTSTKKYVVILKSGSRLTMELTDEMYKSFTGVGVLADAKLCIILDASEVESIKEVKPVTDYTMHTPVKSDGSKIKWLALEVADSDYKEDPERVRIDQSSHLRNAAIIRPTNNPKQRHELLNRAFNHLYLIDTPEVYISYPHNGAREYDYKLFVDMKYDYKLFVDTKGEYGVPLEMFVKEDDVIYMYRTIEGGIRLSTDGIPQNRFVVYNILELKEEDL